MTHIYLLFCCFQLQLIIYSIFCRNGIAWTALVVFLLIYGPVFAIFVMGGVNCYQPRKATNYGSPAKRITKYDSQSANKNMTRNGPMFYSITCDDFDSICVLTATAGILQLHTGITLLLAYLIVKCFEKITVCCRFDV